jgi:hypothetical protein
MIHFSNKIVFLAPLMALLATGCDVSNGSGPGSQSPDPVVVDIPIAFIARSIPLDDDPDASGAAVAQNIFDPAAFNPGARLIIKDRAKFSAPETDLTIGLFPDVLEDPDDPDSDLIPAQIDVKDLETSVNGDKLLFALRAPADPNNDAVQPTWNIWEYSLEGGQVRPLLDPVVAEQGHDVSPHYLPDGRIVFTSTRQKRTRAILLDEGKSQYSGLTESSANQEQALAFNLHVLDPDTGDIEQLSFNPSHDLQPTLLANGRIAFLRWDNLPGHDELSFYSIRPDGTDLQKLYGYNSQNTGPEGTEATFWNSRIAAEGQLLVSFRNRQSRNWGGDIVVIDYDQFTDVDQPNPQNPGSGSAQRSLSPITVSIIENNPAIFSAGGLYNSAFPLNDGTNRVLVSWSPCQLNAIDEMQVYPCTPTFLSIPNISAPTPTFGLWVLDLATGTQQPIKPAVPEINEVFTEVVALSPQIRADNLVSNLDSALATQGVGLIHIRNIYDIDGTLAANVAPVPHLANRMERPARFIRLVKAVPIPDDEVLDFNRNIAFGRNNNRYMRDILGYVPIEPDGSAKFIVPGNLAFSMSLIDATGKRLPNAFHENWLTVKPGESYECVGCHESGSPQPHGRRDAQADSDYLGAPFVGITLVDQNNVAVAEPQTGQSMGEFFADSFGPRIPSIDLLYRDIWTQNSNNLEPDISLAYDSIAPASSTSLPPLNTTCQMPLDPAIWSKPTFCQSSSNTSPFAESTWNSNCRITINYETHIQPLWERDRRNCADQPNLDGSDNILADNTCISCHGIVNQTADGQPLEPAASLFLIREMPLVNVPNELDPTALTTDIGCNQNRSEDFAASYNQLLNTRLALTLVDGQLVPVYTSTPIDTIDPDTGAPVLNEDGTVRQTLVRTCSRLGNPTSTAGASVSQRFFSIFEGNDPIHTGLMSPSELRLVAEWLDLGGQYYNNPFDAPLND